MLRRQNIEQIDKAPYLIVAGWGDEFVSLSVLDGASCAIFLDKVWGRGLRDGWCSRRSQTQFPVVIQIWGARLSNPMSRTMRPLPPKMAAQPKNTGKA